MFLNSFFRELMCKASRKMWFYLRSMHSLLLLLGKVFWRFSLVAFILWLLCSIKTLFGFVYFMQLAENRYVGSNNFNLFNSEGLNKHSPGDIPVLFQ